MADEKKRFFKDAYKLTNVDETRAHYANWAKVYDLELNEESGYQQPKRCADALSKVLTDHRAKILDIGCGTGLSGRALAEAGFTNLDGCDLSAEMLAEAKQAGVYGKLFETNLNEPPMECADASYDAATAVGVFSFGHIEPDAIDDILRVLNPGAPFVIGLNDHFYDLGHFPAKLEALETAGKIQIVDRQHGLHLANIEGSTGWVITTLKS